MVNTKVEIYRKQFDYYKKLAEKSIDQLEERHLFRVESHGVNSISILMKHISGNMISRWTNIFEEDGEKSWRNRDGEFIDDFEDKDALISYWNKGWNVLFDTLDSIEDDDLERMIYIRNMGCSVHDALIRQLCHYPYHIGQIVYIAKVIKGNAFKSLSIPKGESEKYNRERFERAKSIQHFTDDVDK